MDNEKLPAELYKYVGAAIYKGLAYGFEDAVFGGPKPCAAASWDCAVEGVQALASLFADNGFCLKAAMLDVQPGAGKGGTFKVRGSTSPPGVGSGRGGDHGVSNLRPRLRPSELPFSSPAAQLSWSDLREVRFREKIKKREVRAKRRENARRYDTTARPRCGQSRRWPAAEPSCPTSTRAW